MKRCPECGNICTDDSSFCPRCGCILPSEPDPNIPPNYHRPTPRPGPNVSNKAVAVIAVIAILIAVAWSVLQTNTNKDSSEDETKDYSWSVPVEGVSSIKFTVSVTITGEELDLAKSSPIKRDGSSTNDPDCHASGEYQVKEYVVVSDTIKKLAADIWDQYKTKVIDNPLVPVSSKTAEMFANCVLTFVQAAVDYEYDSYQFGEDEYWLYPVETLHYGHGDCEDTSILAAAIYSALAEMEGPSEYVKGTSLFLLPGHAMVGVNVNGGVAGIASKIVVGSEDYYFGETTIDDVRHDWRGIGSLSESFAGASVLAFTGHATDYVR